MKPSLLYALFTKSGFLWSFRTLMWILIRLPSLRSFHEAQLASGSPFWGLDNMAFATMQERIFISPCAQNKHDLCFFEQWLNRNIEKSESLEKISFLCSFRTPMWILISQPRSISLYCGTLNSHSLSLRQCTPSTELPRMRSQ